MNHTISIATVSGREKGLLLLHLGLCALIPAVFVVGYALDLTWSRCGELEDSDCYVHLLRAEELWRTGRWYDPVMERSNAPHGEELHWTRPFDVLLLLGGVPASLFVGLQPALFWWGVIVSPFLLGVTLVVFPWTVRPLLGREGPLVAGLILVCQIGLWAAFEAGRPDHHSLLILLFVLSLGFTIRLIERPFSGALGHAAGAISAMSMWVSVESILPTCLIVVALAALWVLNGGDSRRKALHYSLALSLGLVAALLLERPLPNLAAVEMDRLSIAHGVVFGLNAALWAALSVCHRRAGLLRNRTRRLLALLAGSAVCAGVVLVLLPSWYKGPLANVDPQVVRLYVRKVAEMQPLLKSPARFAVGVPLIGVMLACTPLLLRRVRRGPRPAAWLFVSGALAAFVPLSFLQIRWAGYADVLLTLALTEIILTAWTRLDRWPRGLKRTTARTGVWAACCYFLIFSGCAVDALVGRADQDDKVEDPSLVAVARYLANAEPSGGRRRILAHVFWGGELLYRTGQEVIGTPYHRNTQGILDTHRTFRSETDEETLEVVRKRGIDLILVSPGSKNIRRCYAGKEGVSTFYQRLCDGQVPSWCREVALPPDLAAFRLFEVRRD